MYSHPTTPAQPQPVANAPAAPDLHAWAPAQPLARRLHRCVQRIETFLDRPIHVRKRQINPCRLDAIWWGSADQRFKRSIAFACLLHAIIILLLILPWPLLGCGYNTLPAGGGENSFVAEQIVVQKKKKKKLLVNLRSPVYFNLPDIEELEQVVAEQLKKGTAQLFSLGEGQEAGVGVGGTGVANFVRVAIGPDWDQNLPERADENMLRNFSLLTGMKTAREPLTFSLADLERALNDPNPERVPAFIYVTGDRRFSLSSREVNILRRYAFETHGIIFGDCGGNLGFGPSFRNLIGQVAAGKPVVRVDVPGSDQLYNVPKPVNRGLTIFRHDGTRLVGWKYNDRWICLYHPGDIGDAWKDGHSGLSANVYNEAYKLGANIMYQAYIQQGRWFRAQKERARP